MGEPALTVIMSVYNGAKHLPEAIESILNQTFGEFRFVIVDDGSTDETGTILDDYARKDQRLVVVHQKNAGLTTTLNRIIATTDGELIARMDGDDISLPHRFEKQIAKLRSTPDCIVVGCWFQVITENGTPVREYVFPDNHRILTHNLHRGVNCYAHGSVIMRRKVFSDMGFSYRFRHGQDFDLWLRLSERGRLGLVEDVLYKRRDHNKSISRAVLPQRSALMKLMLLLADERKKHGRELSNWAESEEEVLRTVPLWTEKEIEAYDKFLKVRRLLCAGENRKARIILSTLGEKMSNYSNLAVARYISYFPGFITGPLLRLRDRINSRRLFMRNL